MRDSVGKDQRWETAQCSGNNQYGQVWGRGEPMPPFSYSSHWYLGICLNTRFTHWTVNPMCQSACFHRALPKTEHIIVTCIDAH